MDPTRKIHRGTIELKADSPGEFRATFATFNVIDRDGDVTIPGAFQDGQEVRICAWGHNWGALPVGKGTISQDDSKAWVDGSFFLDTEGGEQTYRTVKNLAGLQEWSYGFDIKEQSFGQFEERDVRFLRALDVFEVSPVMIGAGIGTGTDAIKSAQLEVQPTAAERKSLELLADRYSQASETIKAFLGAIAEDRQPVKAEDSGDGVKAEGTELGQGAGAGNALDMRYRLDVEILAVGADE